MFEPGDEVTLDGEPGVVLASPAPIVRAGVRVLVQLASGERVMAFATEVGPKT